MLQWTGWETVWKLEVAVALGILIFISSHLLNKKTRNEKLHLKSFSWLIVYLILSGIVSYFGTFKGGTGLITMQMAFLVVAITSFIVFILAHKTALSEKESREIYNKLIKDHSSSKK
jgi:drug/metabolite transporter (DMT)-like permease